MNPDGDTRRGDESAGSAGHEGVSRAAPAEKEFDQWIQAEDPKKTTRWTEKAVSGTCARLTGIR